MRLFAILKKIFALFFLRFLPVLVDISGAKNRRFFGLYNFTILFRAEIAPIMQPSRPPKKSTAEKFFSKNFDFGLDKYFRMCYNCLANENKTACDMQPKFKEDAKCKNISSLH